MLSCYVFANTKLLGVIAIFTAKVGAFYPARDLLYLFKSGGPDLLWLLEIGNFFLFYLFLLLAINSAEKCLILKLASFQGWWRPAGTLLGLDVAHEDEKIANLYSTACH